MKKITKLSKFILIMTASERLRSCRGPSRLVHHAISGHRSEASLRSYIGHPSSEKIITCSDILPMLRVEGHISHCSRVLQRCHPERSWLRLVFLPTLLSCSSRFLRALWQKRAQSRLLYLLTRIQELLSNLDEKRWLPAVDTGVHHIKEKWKIKNERKRKRAIAPELLSG